MEADLVVIGPEQPLVDGLADRLRADRRLVFGPGADGARLEGSKAFMKEVLDEAGVPTARYGVFDEAGPAQAFPAPSCPGRGWSRPTGWPRARACSSPTTGPRPRPTSWPSCRGDAFGDAGRRVVVEEGLVGAECSLLVLCDGSRIAALPVAQDYKRLGDGDDGPNTGRDGGLLGRRARRRPRSSTGSSTRRSSRSWRRCGGGGSTTAGCSTPG